MPTIPINYTKSIIYKIVCNDLSITDLYVGSTTDFTMRKYRHKFNCKAHVRKLYNCIRANGGWNNWSMIEIEKFNCNDGNELRSRERFWFETLHATLNSHRPIILDTDTKSDLSTKKYRQINKDKLILYRHAYYLKNKDKYK